MTKLTSVTSQDMVEVVACKICESYTMKNNDICYCCYQGLSHFDNDIDVMHNALAYLIASKQKE